MAKLREAAIVAAMVGSVGMIGAGTASAHGDDAPRGPIHIHCTQNVNDNSRVEQVGLVNINGPLLGGGNADATANQQLCGLENEDPENTAGTGTGGLGGTLGDIGVTL
ncbi:hypothetical protein HCC61_23775 [Streptomyces sp. HNM0575]|uniref:hypothetical protein n=1 Tax=Streptomyces sp. HNM0575 TaxID=2716338 RepID=UPI00145F54BB|nr:hypothetical protein [Streptomyces sp. HNM0575]NLU75640.1 hypothetical protein [Streptomyces sp. HNM0575]